MWLAPGFALSTASLKRHPQRLNTLPLTEFNSQKVQKQNKLQTLKVFLCNWSAKIRKEDCSVSPEFWIISYPNPRILAFFEFHSPAILESLLGFSLRKKELVTVAGRAPERCVRVLSSLCPPGACSCPAVVLWARWATLCPPRLLSWCLQLYIQLLSANPVSNCCPLVDASLATAASQSPDLILPLSSSCPPVVPLLFFCWCPDGSMAPCRRDTMTVCTREAKGPTLQAIAHA